MYVFTGMVSDDRRYTAMPSMFNYKRNVLHTLRKGAPYMCLLHKLSNKMPHVQRYPVAKSYQTSSSRRFDIKAK